MRNGVLLVASLLFYAWGEGIYVLFLLSAVVINYLGGLGVEHSKNVHQRRLLLWLATAANLLLLISVKYAAFLAVNVNSVLSLFGLSSLPVHSLHLPIGISFFTFMGMSYVIDINRRQIRAEKLPGKFALYMTLFPHLIAGPIVRYREIAAEITNRMVTRPDFAEGIRRFVVGLGKKVLVANTVAATADSIFSISPAQLTPGAAWLGITCYTLQIYFDFSGYSDMAIGLARMFGFHFPENFNYPYIAESVNDFWRRWHITLSSWFRDYLFFSLGVRHARRRLYLNLLVVFFLCGLWHGASWSFVVWGLFHGTFLVFERMGLTKWMTRWPETLRHIYALLVIMVGWVLFRAETLSGALGFLAAMVYPAPGGVVEYGVSAFVNNQLMIALAAGALGSTPLVTSLQRHHEQHAAASSGKGTTVLIASVRLLRLAALAAILIASVALSAAGTYNPFIYFRF
jgi:alginate O-acetyltransferase complex protein AlgI